MYETPELGKLNGGGDAAPTGGTSKKKYTDTL